jgi:hypothetical protein
VVISPGAMVLESRLATMNTSQGTSRRRGVVDTFFFRPNFPGAPLSLGFGLKTLSSRTNAP